MMFFSSCTWAWNTQRRIQPTHWERQIHQGESFSNGLFIKSEAKQGNLEWAPLNASLPILLSQSSFFWNELFSSFWNQSALQRHKQMQHKSSRSAFSPSSNKWALQGKISQNWSFPQRGKQDGHIEPNFALTPFCSFRYSIEFVTARLLMILCLKHSTPYVVMNMNFTAQ